MAAQQNRDPLATMSIEALQALAVWLGDAGPTHPPRLVLCGAPGTRERSNGDPRGGRRGKARGGWARKKAEFPWVWAVSGGRCGGGHASRPSSRARIPVVSATPGRKVPRCMLPGERRGRVSPSPSGSSQAGMSPGTATRRALARCVWPEQLSPAAAACCRKILLGWRARSPSRPAQCRAGGTELVGGMTCHMARFLAWLDEGGRGFTDAEWETIPRECSQTHPQRWPLCKACYNRLPAQAAGEWFNLYMQQFGENDMLREWEAAAWAGGSGARGAAEPPPAAEAAVAGPASAAAAPPAAAEPGRRRSRGSGGGAAATAGGAGSRARRRSPGARAAGAAAGSSRPAPAPAAAPAGGRRSRERSPLPPGVRARVTVSSSGSPSWTSHTSSASQTPAAPVPAPAAAAAGRATGRPAPEARPAGEAPPPPRGRGVPHEGGRRRTPRRRRSPARRRRSREAARRRRSRTRSPRSRRRCRRRSATPDRAARRAGALVVRPRGSAPSLRLVPGPGAGSEAVAAGDLAGSRETAARWVEAMVGMAFRSGWQWRETEEDAERWRRGGGDRRRR